MENLRNTQILLLILLPFLLKCSCWKIDVYDCSKPKVSKIVRTDKIESCEKSQTQKLKPIYERQLTLLQYTPISQVSLQACDITYKVSIYYCSIFASKNTVYEDKFPVNYQISHTECADLHKTGIFKPSKLLSKKFNIEKNNENIFQALLQNAHPADKNCAFPFRGYTLHKNSYTSKSGNVLFTFNVRIYNTTVSVDRKAKKILHKTYHFCDTNKPVCHLRKTTLVLYFGNLWTECEYMKIRTLLFEIWHTSVNNVYEIGNRTIISKNKNYTIRFKTEKFPTNLCNMVAYKTNYKTIYVIDKKFAYHFKPISSENIDLVLSTQISNNFVYDHIKDVFNKSQAANRMNLCQITRKVLKNRLHLLQLLGSTQRVMKISNDPVIFLRNSGSLGQFIKCAKLSAHIVPSANCTNDISIIFNNKSAYIDPITKIILKKSKKIVCENIPPKFLQANDGTWLKIHQENINVIPDPSKYPLKLSTNIEFYDIHSMENSGLYSRQQIHDFYKLIVFGQNQDPYNQKILENYLINLENKFINWKKFGTPDLIQSKIEKSLNKLFGFFQIFGQWSSFFIGIAYCIVIIKFLGNKFLDFIALNSFMKTTKAIIHTMVPFAAKHKLNKHRFHQNQNIESLAKMNIQDNQELEETIYANIDKNGQPTNHSIYPSLNL